MFELKQKERVLLSYFRHNARESLTAISRQTRMPVSTIFDKLKHYEQNFIKKHTTLIDFSKLGYLTRAKVLIKFRVDHRNSAKEFLLKHENVNSLYKVNNGFDYLVEIVFHHIRELEDFLEDLEMKYEVVSKNVFYIIEELSREKFMADPALVKLKEVQV